MSDLYDEVSSPSPTPAPLSAHGPLVHADDDSKLTDDSSSTATGSGNSLPPPRTTATRQFAAAFALPVVPGQANIDPLKKLLEEIAAQTTAAMRGQPDPQAILPFHALPAIHYARLVLIEDWPKFSPVLVLATDYDGLPGEAEWSEAAALDHHVQELSKLGGGLPRLLAHCKGSAGKSAADYLRSHRLASKTFYVGAPGRSRGQIEWEARLRRRVRELVAEHAPQKLHPEKLRERVRDQLIRDGWQLKGFPGQPQLEGKLIRAIAMRVIVLLAVLGGLFWLVYSGFGVPGLAAALGGMLLVAGLTVWRFRYLEKTDPQFEPVFDNATHERLRRASAHENEFPQNQLTHLVALKPGPLRWLLIRVVFDVLQLLATYRYNRGKLGDIPSIHFARWMLVPGRGVLFFSNFDSSWQSYLGDFIDKASVGLTAVWSNTQEYPRTTWLLEAGADDASRFLAWTRHNQRPTDVWYAAYPNLSIVNINDNTEVHRGLADPECIDARTWLYRVHGIDQSAADEQFSEAQVTEPPLPLDRIQGLIVRGYGHMPEARYLMFRVRAPQSKKPLAWLGSLELTSAHDGARAAQSPGPLLNVAFSHEGLLALGVHPDLAQSFSTAFVRGAHDPDRARTNGDVGDNAPENWRWGSADKPVHIVLLVFAKQAADADAEAKKHIHQAFHHDLDLVMQLEGTELPGRKEHFGFRDGIGQPQIQGCGGTGREEDAIAAGEFLLGRRNGYGNRTHAPESPNGFNFGHNGSYLVFRQLAQDVPAFWKYCSEQGGGEQHAVATAAKMVGRWPSGAPLIRHADKDPKQDRFQDDDNFTYIANDEDNDRFGARCPFGAHIRRANPRDWNLGTSREESLRIANLHRIVRRGRPYGPPFVDSMNPEELVKEARKGAPAKDAERGLQFLCFNADIERQFEFIQQHWCNNPHFAGLDNGPDQLLGIQPRFIRVIGASYFFMPSIPAVKLLANDLLSRGAPAKLEHPPRDEQLAIDSLIKTLRRKMTADYKGGTMLRGAHPKMHGCVKAEFRVQAGLSPELKVGLFAQPRAYSAWVRFSNESGDVNADIESGIRGVALKLMNVDGAKLLDGEEESKSHDLILISTDKFVTKDAAEFDGLVRAVGLDKRHRKARVIWYMLRHPRVGMNYQSAQKRYGDVLDITYFSATPYLLGTRAVKYMLRPTHPEQTPVPNDPDYNYLARVMDERLARTSVTFEFCIQVQADPKSMPVEDPGVAWDPKKAPFQKVATLTIPRQVFNTPEQREFGENLSFNPWRCLPEHRPLGGVNRARRQVYRAITRFRHARNDAPMSEP
jgi:Dyp-type peroxidase family